MGVAFLKFVLLVLLAAYNHFKETRVCMAMRACVHREQDPDGANELMELVDDGREINHDSSDSESQQDEYSLPTY